MLVRYKLYSFIIKILVFNLKKIGTLKIYGIACVVLLIGKENEKLAIQWLIAYTKTNSRNWFLIEIDFSDKFMCNTRKITFDMNEIKTSLYFMS